MSNSEQGYTLCPYEAWTYMRQHRYADMRVLRMQHATQQRQPLVYMYMRLGAMVRFQES